MTSFVDTGAFCSLPYSPQEAVLFPEAPVQINIGLSLGALFDMREARKVFDTYGAAAYVAYMKQRIHEPLQIGPAFHSIKKLTRFNKHGCEPLIRNFILSRLSHEADARVALSLAHHGLTRLDKTQAEQGFFSFYGQEAIAPYMTNGESGIDLILSTRLDDTIKALECGVPAGYVDPDYIPQEQATKDFVLGVDIDRVMFLFFGKPPRKRALIPNETYLIDNEELTRRKGLPVAHNREHACRAVPGHLGPSGPFVFKMFVLRGVVNPDPDLSNLSIPAITARSGNARKRAKNTFRAYNMKPDGVVSVGWDPKGPVAAEKQVDLFLDDGEKHINSVREESPGTLPVYVPWTSAHVDRLAKNGLPDSRKVAKQIACAFG